MEQKADELANRFTCRSTSHRGQPQIFHQQSLGLVSWNNMHVIDRDSQNVIQPLIFNSMINNSSFTSIKTQLHNCDIDWTFTKE